jgi:protein required for attachment to host cells
VATEYLERAYKAAAECSSKEQDILAAKILQEIEKMKADREWDTLLASPRSLAHMRKMKEEIEADIASGEIEDGGFDCCEEPAH